MKENGTDRILFRNNVPFGEIEEQSLWKKEGENFILVDDDDFKMLPVKCWEHCFDLEKERSES